MRSALAGQSLAIGILAAALLTAPDFSRTCVATIDLTGNWDVTVTVDSFPPANLHWAIVQSSGTLVISTDGVSAPFYTGTIDPDTGALSFGGVLADCLPPLPDSFTGTAAGDSNSFTASGTMFLKVSPLLCGGPFPASLTATRGLCGNGVVDPGEACDDGNLLAHDCCSFTCSLQPTGSLCDDGDLATPYSVCTAGSCTAPATGCVATPVGGCASPGKSLLLLKDQGFSGASPGDRLIWKWLKGPATALGDFGNPTTTADYSLCVYAGTSQTLALDASVPPVTNWETLGTKGYKYKDAGAAAAGIFQILLKSGAAGSSKILAKGKDGALYLAPGTLPFDSAANVTVQVVNSDNPNCWEATFAPSAFKKNTTAEFKAKSP